MNDTVATFLYFLQDVWNTDKRGWSILHHAAFHGRMCVIQVRLSHNIIPRMCVYGHTLRINWQDLLRE